MIAVAPTGFMARALGGTGDVDDLAAYLRATEHQPLWILMAALVALRYSKTRIQAAYVLYVDGKIPA